MKIRFFRRMCVMLIFISAAPLTVFPFTDQTTSERILKENKHFVEFLDSGITNFAENRVEDYKKAYSLHFNADVAYLQADYIRAFKRVYASQKSLSQLYSDVVKDIYLEESKNILDTIAPLVIKSKNARARLFLTLGYRDRTISWTHYTIGDASNPKLYSYRIYRYIKAIEYARRAKRYAFLALFESQDPDMKRRIFSNMLKSENQTGNPFFKRFVDLGEKDYLREIGKNYEDYEKDMKEQAAEPSKEPGIAMVFEKKVEKRVRFRNEKRAAKFLINTEYDQAEDIMRSYVSDFNFKLINSVFEVLSSANATEKNKEKNSSEGIDFNKYKIHLLDNYARITKDSTLASFYGSISVEDAVSESKIKEETGDEHAEQEKAEPLKTDVDVKKN